VVLANIYNSPPSEKNQFIGFHTANGKKLVSFDAEKLRKAAEIFDNDGFTLNNAQSYLDHDKRKTPFQDKEGMRSLNENFLQKKDSDHVPSANLLACNITEHEMIKTKITDIPVSVGFASASGKPLKTKPSVQALKKAAVLFEDEFLENLTIPKVVSECNIPRSRDFLGFASASGQPLKTKPTNQALKNAITLFEEDFLENLNNDSLQLVTDTPSKCKLNSNPLETKTPANKSRKLYTQLEEVALLRSGRDQGRLTRKGAIHLGYISTSCDFRGGNYSAFYAVTIRLESCQ
jgi:hypothetical protein